MTGSGDPNENRTGGPAMAERVLRSLKDDCKLARGFTSFSAAVEAVERAIDAYNTVRPHASLNYLTPHQMHQRKRNPSSAGIRIRKSGTEMYNMKRFSADFNNCPTQSVAYELLYNHLYVKYYTMYDINRDRLASCMTFLNSHNEGLVTEC